jgi:hypothetical protein
MTTVKKVLGCLNALTQEAKLDTVDKVLLFLKERLEGDQEQLEKLLLEFKDTVSADPDPFSTVKTKAKTKTPRPPTAYNLFIKETMEKLKKEDPTQSNTSLMSSSAKLWTEHKATLAAAAALETPLVDSVPSGAPVDTVTSEVPVKKVKKATKKAVEKAVVA